MPPIGPPSSQILPMLNRAVQLLEALFPDHPKTTYSYIDGHNWEIKIELTSETFSVKNNVDVDGGKMTFTVSAIVKGATDTLPPGWTRVDSEHATGSIDLPPGVAPFVNVTYGGLGALTVDILPPGTG